MGANESREELSEDILYEKVNNIHKFLSENNIDNILTSEQKDEFSQMFNDLLDYLSLYILDNETTSEILKSIDNEFDDDIVSETFYFIENMKDFIRKKESIEILINEKQDLSELLKKFKYVYQQKDQIFEPDNELKNNLDFILQYIKRKNDDMNGLNETMNGLNNSLKKLTSTFENYMRSIEINEEIKILSENNEFNSENLNSFVTQYITKFIKPKKLLELNENIITNKNKIKELKVEAIEIQKKESEFLNSLSTKKRELVLDYRAGRITQDQFNENYYEKSYDEINDDKYRIELTRIIEIYNNSSKTESDKKEIVTKMDDFIKSIQIDESLLTVFNN